MAAIFHDYAKFRPKEEMKQIIVREKSDPRFFLSQIRSHRGMPQLGIVIQELSRHFFPHGFGADPKKAEMAAIFHDYAKFRPKEEMKQIIVREISDPRFFLSQIRSHRGMPQLGIVIQELSRHFFPVRSRPEKSGNGGYFS
jgi:HD superfamily phosphohydrolase YqeK